MSDILRDIYENYKTWIINNPQKIGDYETLVKWISYFIAGRINNSIVVSELVYSLSNLLVLFNDRILASRNITFSDDQREKIKIYITVVEYCEVFLELSAQKLRGTHGKWCVVAIIQGLKCLAKLILIHRFKEAVTQNPTLMPINRMDVTNESTNGNTSVAQIAEVQRNTVSFALRSGRTIRKIDAAPTARNWKPIPQQTIESSLAGQQLIAETLYIVKPIIHLCATGCFGNNTWKPWVISLAVDIVSLHLYNNCRKTKENCLSRDQGLQLSKRYLHLLLYLLRSPFYEKYSKDRLNSSLQSIGKSVPLAHVITTPLQQYIPFWQSNYFYMWSS